VSTKYPAPPGEATRGGPGAGHKEQAQATLTQLRELMKQPSWKENSEAQAFLREAEGLIEGKAGDKRK
jgi:hypothetical protein